MIKKTVTYTDWDGRQRTEDLYFNLSRNDVLKELSLIDRMERFKAEVIDGAKREMTTAEKQEMVDLIRSFFRLSYGERKDARTFRKSPEIWADFEGSGAFEAYFWQIFTDENEFSNFMQGILPADLLQQARSQMTGQELMMFDETVGTPPPIPQPEDTPSKPLNEMTPEQLRARLAELEALGQKVAESNQNNES